MTLAQDEIRITIDGHEVTLRPTLRAAVRLERRHGFKAVFDGISTGSINVMADVILIAGDYPAAVAAILREIEENGIVRLDALKAPMIAFLMNMIAVDEQGEHVSAKAETKGESPTQSFASYHEHLFRIGTGWLSWTPEQTWNATPAEISAAYEGRIDMLKAIFGGKDDNAEPAPSKESLSKKIKSVFAGLGTTKIAKKAVA